MTKGGADFVIDYGREGWQKEVIKITGGKGVDVVYDPVVSFASSFISVVVFFMLFFFRLASSLSCLLFAVGESRIVRSLTTSTIS